MFGTHAVFDLNSCDRNKLNNLELIYKILDELPEKVDMHKITQPQVFRYSGINPEDAGITGLVVIAESHLAIHTFAEKGFASFDIFTCKEGMDIEFITDYITKALGARSYEKNVFNRGRHFPKNTIRLGQIMSLNRERAAPSAHMTVQKF